jgi:polysaccharide biosynthesis transport protein
LEASCLNKYSDAHELVAFVDKLIPVFDANTSITSADRESIAYIKSLGDKVLGGILNKADIKNVQ